MSTDRRFCRFSPGASNVAFGMAEVPQDGLCLCAFVVLSSSENPTRVLLGKLNPDAPWDHLGALDPARLAAWKDQWMLPSSHLMMLEDPSDAAARIVRELVGVPARALEGPLVTSEVYTPQRNPGATHHWDLEFIFRGRLPESEVRPVPAWRELKFVETRTLSADDVARSQGDILVRAGHALKG